MKNIKYSAALNVLSHLVLTKPNVALKFLHNHGIDLDPEASSSELLDTLIDLIGENDPLVMQDLVSLFASHLTYKGQELLALGGKNLQAEEDEFIGGIITAATGLAQGIGSMIGAKKQRKAQEAAHKRETQAALAAAKTEQARIDAQARLQTLQLQQQQQANALKAQMEKQKADREEKEKKEEKAKAAEQRKWMMVGGGVLAVVVILGFLKNRIPRPRIPAAIAS